MERSCNTAAASVEHSLDVARLWSDVHNLHTVWFLVGRMFRVGLTALWEICGSSSPQCVCDVALPLLCA